MKTRQLSSSLSSLLTATFMALLPAVACAQAYPVKPKSLIYRRTKNLRAAQLLLGHTKLESTVRYLGIEVDDALGMAEQTEV